MGVRIRFCHHWGVRFRPINPDKASLKITRYYLNISTRPSIWGTGLEKANSHQLGLLGHGGLHYRGGNVIQDNPLSVVKANSRRHRLKSNGIIVNRNTAISFK